jgi:MOSC domain-containing protein YiiM
MNTTARNTSGWVASLHLHPSEPGTPLQSVDAIEAIASKGIAGEPRYFGRTSQTTGKPHRRQLSLIAREQIAEHAAALGLETIPPGAVRANIETLGLHLGSLVGRSVAIGDAVLFLYEPRRPCEKMDAVCHGLRALMADGRQGVMAEIIQSGRIRVNDPIRLVEARLPA